MEIYRFELGIFIEVMNSFKQNTKFMVLFSDVPTVTWAHGVNIKILMDHICVSIFLFFGNQSEIDLFSSFI